MWRSEQKAALAHSAKTESQQLARHLELQQRGRYFQLQQRESHLELQQRVERRPTRAAAAAAAAWKAWRIWVQLMVESLEALPWWHAQLVGEAACWRYVHTPSPRRLVWCVAARASRDHAAAALPPEPPADCKHLTLILGVCLTLC